MSTLFSRVKRPVRRFGAERYLRFSLLSFAATVILVRLFLALTGYPQIGSGTLHIAHVLWGGLALFIAALLPLILANRWAYTVSGVLSGVGVGLFIDEVGKFITRTNDYFYPPAAPIIYGFFLLTVLLYTRVRHQPQRSDPRTELYHALDALEEVLDHDLSQRERAELEARLQLVMRQADEREFSRLASVLFYFLRSGVVSALPDRPGFGERLWLRLEAWQRRFVRRPLFRVLLVLGLALFGLYALLNLLQWALTASSASFQPLIALVTLGGLVGVNASTGGTAWLLVRIVLEAAVGVILLAGVRFVVAGDEERGLRLGYYGLLFSLTTANLLVFYFDQFRALFITLAQLALLLTILYYRRQYLDGGAAARPAAAPPPPAHERGLIQ